MTVASGLRNTFFACALAACSSNETPPATADAGSEAGQQQRDSGAAENPNPCDVVAQDCSVAPATRCSIVGTIPYAAQCVTASGTKEIGDFCTPNLVDGDDCKKGAFCSIDGFGQKDPRCARLCRVATDCGPGESCVNVQFVVNDQSSRPNFRDGVCAKACTPFDDCGAGKTCGWAVFTPAKQTMILCRPIGSVEIGGTCAFDDECIANAVCDPFHHCAALCDSTHPCSTDADGGTLTCAGGICK